MRTISAAQAAVRASGAQADHVRVQVKDAGGAWRDLTSYPGFNALEAVGVKNDVGSPHATADVEMKREAFKLSLSPYMAGSPLNRGFDPLASPVALLALGREFKVEVAVTPMDRAPSSGDWLEVFSGRIDNLDPGAGDKVRFGGRDKAGRIADQQIKKERVYAFATDGGVAVSLRPWEPGMVVALNEYVLPASNGTGDPGAGKFLKCSQAGTTGNTEPVWTTGTNQVDGTAKWNYVGAPSSTGRPVEQVMQNLLDDNKAAGDASVTLYVPSSPGWAIKEFIQSREKNLAAIRALAQQIGWDVRMKWRAGTSQFELTLFEPERAKATVDYTFAAADFNEPTKLETSLEAIRNSWQLVYSDAADTWPDGSPKRKVVTAVDAASVTKYGELWAEIAEPSGGNIDSATEATKMVDAALSDCAEPTADFAVTLAQGFPWVELGDRYTFAADGRRFDSAQTFAVTGWTLRYEKGRLRTELAMRGKPGLSAWQWVAMSTAMPFFQTETQQPAPLAHWGGPKTASVEVVPIPGGASIHVVDGVDKLRAAAEYEIHLSESSGFDPDDTTLQGVIADQVLTIEGLRPGRTHYGKLVPRVRQKSGKVSRGQPGAQWSFVAGRVDAGMVHRLAVPEGPPNGSFEANYDTSELATDPPEHWALEAGTWGSTGDVWRALVAEHGYVVHLRQTATQGVLASPVFPLAASDDPTLTLAMLVSPSGTLSAGRGLQVQVLFFSDPDGVYSVGDVDVVCPYNHTTAGTWAEFSGVVTPPAGAAYAKVRFYKESASSAFGWSVANIRLAPSRQQVKKLTVTEKATLAQDAWTAPTLGTNWSNVGGANMAAGYFKDSAGVVHLRGLVQRSSGGAAVFQLPVGFRPSAAIWFLQPNDVSTSHYIYIQSSGDVHVGTFAAGAVSVAILISLDGITFDTR